MGNYSMPGYFQQMPVIQGKKYHPAADNEAELKGIEAELHKKIEEMLAAGTPDDKIHAKGQYTAMERINELVDEGSFLPLNSLYNPADNDEQKIGIIGTSIVKGLGRIDGKWAVIVASDNKKMAGAWVAGQADDLLRGSDTAKMLHIPLVYILNCSGVKLDEQEKVYPNRRGGGTPFYRNAQLNQLGVPVIVGIYGTNPAGGGYHSISPTILIAHQKANMAVGGAGIVGGMDSKPYVDAEGAQGMIDATRKMKNDPPGSVSIHYNETGFFREVYAEEFGVLDGIRKYMGMLPAYDLDFFRVDTPKAPAIQGEELYHIVSRNTRRPYDMYNVLAALVDGGEFMEFKKSYGPEMITGLAKVNGLLVGVVANQQGPLAFLLIACGVGQLLLQIRQAILPNLNIPIHVMCMLAGIIVRFVMDKTGTGSEEMYAHFDSIGDICLAIFVSMAITTMKLWQLIDLALPLITILLLQLVLIYVFVRFITFNACGRDYDAAIIAVGHTGFGLGAVPGSMATMSSVCEEYRYSKLAYFVVPLIGEFISNLTNAIAITTFMNIAAGML